jgi:hypothetical protein
MKNVKVYANFCQFRDGEPEYEFHYVDVVYRHGAQVRIITNNTEIILPVDVIIEIE